MGVKTRWLGTFVSFKQSLCKQSGRCSEVATKVKVSVLEVDVARKRISLSMKNVSDNSVNKKPIVQKQAPQRHTPQRLPENKNDFQR